MQKITPLCLKIEHRRLPKKNGITRKEREAPIEPNRDQGNHKWTTRSRSHHADGRDPRSDHSNNLAGTRYQGSRCRRGTGRRERCRSPKEGTCNAALRDTSKKDAKSCPRRTGKVIDQDHGIVHGQAPDSRLDSPSTGKNQDTIKDIIMMSFLHCIAAILMIAYQITSIAWEKGISFVRKGKTKPMTIYQLLKVCKRRHFRKERLKPQRPKIRTYFMLYLMVIQDTGAYALPRQTRQLDHDEAMMMQQPGPSRMTSRDEAEDYLKEAWPMSREHPTATWFHPFRGAHNYISNRRFTLVKPKEDLQQACSL